MTRSHQLVLPLPERVLLGRENFFVADSNRAALEAIEAWPEWPGGMLALIGPEGSGKTHLSELHATRAAAVLWPSTGANLIVEDVDRLVGDRTTEETLFHAFNRAVAEGGSILFTARTPLAGWPVALGDLRTRLNTVHAVDLLPPDDTLLAAVMLKLFADRQIDPQRAGEVAAWLVPRIDRSLASARRVIEALDARSLSEKRRIDTRLAAEILQSSQEL